MASQLTVYASNKRLMPVHNSLYLEVNSYYSPKENRRVTSGAQLIRFEPEIDNGQIKLDTDGNVTIVQKGVSFRMNMDELAALEKRLPSYVTSLMEKSESSSIEEKIQKGIKRFQDETFEQQLDKELMEVDLAQLGNRALPNPALASQSMVSASIGSQLPVRPIPMVPVSPLHSMPSQLPNGVFAPSHFMNGPGPILTSPAHSFPPQFPINGARPIITSLPQFPINGVPPIITSPPHSLPSHFVNGGPRPMIPVFPNGAHSMLPPHLLGQNGLRPILPPNFTAAALASRSIPPPQMPALESQNVWQPALPRQTSGNDTVTQPQPRFGTLIPPQQSE